MTNLSTEGPEMKNPKLRATMTASRRALLKAEAMLRESNRMWSRTGRAERQITGEDAVRTTDRVLRQALRGTGTLPNHDGDPHEHIMWQATYSGFETAAATIWAAVATCKNPQKKAREEGQTPENAGIMLITAGLRAARTNVTELLSTCQKVNETLNGTGPSDLSEFLAVTQARWEMSTEDALAHMGAWKQRAEPEGKTTSPRPAT